MTTSPPTTVGPTTLATTATPTTSAPTTLATTSAPTTLATTVAPTTTSTTSAPTTTLTTVAPTTAVPDTIIEAGPIELVVTNKGILSKYPAAERDETLDRRYKAGPIDVRLSLIGETLNKRIEADPINISIEPASAKFINGVVVSADAINLYITPYSFGLTLGHNKCNWIKWSKVGELDFTIDRSNVAGERPMDWRGCVYKILKLGDKVVVYGKNGVSFLLPNGINWALNTVFRSGVLGPNAIVGLDQVHYFISQSGDLYEVSEGIEKKGYSEFLSNLTDPVMTIDTKKWLIYICDGTYGYVYNMELGSLGEGPANITGIGYQGGERYITSPESIDMPSIEICTDTYDLNTRKFKTIHSIEVGTNLTEHLMASIDYRVSNRGEFKQIGWFLVNPDGVAFPICYGVEFRFRLKSYIYEELFIDYIKINGAIHNYSYRDYLSGLR